LENGRINRKKEEEGATKKNRYGRGGGIIRPSWELANQFQERTASRE